MVHPDSHRVPRVPWYSGYSLELFKISHTGLSPSMAGLSRPFRYPSDPMSTEPTTPEITEVIFPPVWPLPVSLAATQGISIDFFSFGY
jgi:hypothetical protein